MKRHTLHVLTAAVLFAPALMAQNIDNDEAERTLTAVRVASPPQIDGVVDEWWDRPETGEWSGTFTRQQPEQGTPSTQETRVKVLYDNQYVYVAFRNFDTEPDKINRWLAPRDQMAGDVVAICFDSYHDRRTAFAFALTAGGTRVDFLIQNTANDDFTWNAVWDGETSADGRGWYAEYRIPLSQLRYSNTEGEQTWGVHAIRSIDRLQEVSHLHLVPRQNRGYVYEFATLNGISGLPRSRRIELSPYTSLRYISSEAEAGNPYRTGSDWGYGVGLDGKIGLTSDFTLDFTINPDFGQVEADPSTINLTSFETRYEEKRPFFLEGQSIYEMQGASRSYFGGSDESMFYSRRIGSPPQWSPDQSLGQYSHVPDQTTILSAIKVSGKSKRGLALSVLNSITAREKANLTLDGQEYRMTAQPLTSYSVARVQQDINGGNTIIGGYVTAVNRSIAGDDHLDFMARNAYTGAIDFSQYFLDRQYYIRGNLKYSTIDGSAEAITRLQSSPVHYYQREGAPHLSVDPTLTRLSGNGGAIVIGRGGNNKLSTEHSFRWRSPGFDLNDAGYLNGADIKELDGEVSWQQNNPQSRLLRDYSFTAGYGAEWDYGGLNTAINAEMEVEATFVNRWGVDVGGSYDFRKVEIAMLRGGPPVLLNPSWGADLRVFSDESKKLSTMLMYGSELGRQINRQSLSASLSYRPIPNLGLAADVEYSRSNNGMEWAASPALDQGEGRAYVMSGLKHTVMGLTLRVDYSITPDLSIQFYGNPFISYGRYSDFKRATNTLAADYEERFRRLTPGEIAYDAAANSYSVAEKGGDSYSFRNPDFSFREFRFNLVARWEWKPNSIFYLVWGQDRSGREAHYNSSPAQNVNRLFGYRATNVFMMKFNYWFSL